MKATLVLVFSCLSLITALAQQRKGEGTIYGTVVSQNGQPVKQISVYAEPLDGSGQFPTTTSNGRGEYRFQNLPWGKYTVFADDHDAGYSGEVLDDDTQPSVEISRESPKAEFRVVLPPKAGFLSIQLTNRRTGAAIPWMGVSYARVDKPRQTHSSTCKSTEVILVPPDTFLILHVTAEGFLEWDESAEEGKSIFLPSGTRLTLAVQLEPTQ